MKKLSIIILIVSLCLIAPNVYAQTCNDNAYNILAESTVKLNIKATDGNYYGCTGIIIKKTNNSMGILTAKHCTATSDTIYIDSKYIVDKIVESPMYDFSYLVINKVIMHKNPVKIAKNNARVNESVYSLGYVRTEVIYNCSVIIDKGIKHFYSDAVIKHGCSGSGVINSRGELVGIVWGGRMFPSDIEKGTAIVTNIKPIRRFLTKIKVLKHNTILIK